MNFNKYRGMGEIYETTDEKLRSKCYKITMGFDLTLYYDISSALAIPLYERHKENIYLHIRNRAREEFKDEN